MAGSNAIRRSSDGCVGVSKCLQDDKTLGILACGGEWLSGHLESYPAPRRKVGPECKQREQMESPWWSPGEHDWVGMGGSQGKQTLKCKTVCLSLIFFQSPGYFSGNCSYSLGCMSIHEPGASFWPFWLSFARLSVYLLYKGH